MLLPHRSGFRNLAAMTENPQANRYHLCAEAERCEIVAMDQDACSIHI